MITLWHNPRCSKSRAALALLEERGVEVEVVRYLETPPDAATLTWVLERLGMSPRELMRRREEPYRRLGLDDPSVPDERLVRGMVEEPILIERPIAIRDDRTILGRPPEAVLTLLDE